MRPTSDTVKTLKARLRAYGLPVGGTLDQLAMRLSRLDGLRKRWHGDRQKLEALTVPQLKEMLDSLQVKAWKMPRKSQLVQSLARITGMAEPQPSAPAVVSTRQWSVVWLNPATLQREVHTDGLSRAAAERLEASVRNRLQNAFVSLGPHLEEFSPRGDHHTPVVYSTRSSDAAQPAGTSAEGEAAEALWEIVNLERSCMGPALSGDVGSCRSIARKIERAKADLEDARARVRAERGLL